MTGAVFLNSDRTLKRPQEQLCLLLVAYRNGGSNAHEMRCRHCYVVRRPISLTLYLPTELLDNILTLELDYNLNRSIVGYRVSTNTFHIQKPRRVVAANKTVFGSN